MGETGKQRPGRNRRQRCFKRRTPDLTPRIMRLSILFRDRTETVELPLMSKDDAAHRILDELVKLRSEKGPCGGTVTTNDSRSNEQRTRLSCWSKRASTFATLENSGRRRRQGDLSKTDSAGRADAASAKPEQPRTTSAPVSSTVAADENSALFARMAPKTPPVTKPPPGQSLRRTCLRQSPLFRRPRKLWKTSGATLAIARAADCAKAERRS